MSSQSAMPYVTYEGPAKWCFNDIEDKEVGFWTKRLKNFPEMKQLDFIGPFGVKCAIHGGGLTNEGAKAVIKAVALHPSIIHLSLDGNANMDSGILIKIYKLLKKTETLEFLSIRDCGLTRKNFDFLAEGIRKNKSLKEIRINTNCIPSECWDMLRDAAKERGIPLAVN